MVDAIHIHEDDEGMRNLYPLAAEEEAAADMIAAHEAGERNRAPSGIGWTDIYMIRRPSISYLDAGLRLADAAAALEAIMPRVRTFKATITAGFAGDTHDPLGPCESDAWCFGHGAHCFIKLEPKDDLVRDIWFELRGTGPADAAALRAAIESVDRLVPSYLTDYWMSFAGPADGDVLDEYFALLAREEARIAASLGES